MNKVPYTKVSLTYKEQLEQLKKRGLNTDPEGKTLHLLSNISYYRLSGYWYPLLADKQKHLFKPNASFTTAFKLYCFDRELRQMVLAELEKIEVAVRAKMTYILSHKHGPFWFLNETLFSPQLTYKLTLEKINTEYIRSDEEFIVAFKEKYSNDFPPSWMTTEIISFGLLSKLYQSLLPGIEKREIAHYFGLADRVFVTWLHSIVYLRNVCAHHTRLWNRAMRIHPQVPRNPHKTWLANTDVAKDRTYYILTMICYLLQTVNPKNSFPLRFKALLAKYPNVSPRAMGFPVNWQHEPLWK